MRNNLKAIRVFILAQTIVTVLFFFIIGRAAHPFSYMLNTNDVSFYLFASSLLFLPVYIVLGFISAKVFRLASHKAVVSTAITGSIALTALWLLLVVASNADHSLVLLYAILNAPAGWAYMPISNTAGYLNACNLFFTVLPPVAFAFGIWLHQWIQSRTSDKKEFV